MIFLILFFLVILFSVTAFFYFSKHRKELVKRNQEYLELRQWRGVLDDKSLSDLKWKIRSEVEFQSFYKKLSERITLNKKWGVEVTKKLESAEWFFGMTCEQLVDVKGEPSDKVDDEIRKVVRSKFGTFADVKKKSTWTYSDGSKFIFVNSKLENWQ